MFFCFRKPTDYFDDEAPLTESEPVERASAAPKAKAKPISKQIIQEPVDSVKHLNLFNLLNL